jgi:hypothetical protein
LNSVRIIDVDRAFHKETVPTWPNFTGAQDDLISRRLANTPLLPSTVARLEEVQPIFHSPEFRQALLNRGKSPERIDSMISRLDWFVQEKTLPSVAASGHL